MAHYEIERCHWGLLDFALMRLELRLVNKLSPKWRFAVVCGSAFSTVIKKMKKGMKN